MQKNQEIRDILNNVKHAKTVIMNRFTGEVVDSIPEGSKPGEYRVQQDFTDVPSHTDQSQIYENNVSKLVEKYAPDELAQYLAAKNQNRPVILDHDFSQEPELMYAMNSAVQIQREFDNLPQLLKDFFHNKPAEFLKFCENPKNRAQVEAWGLAQKSPETIEALNAIQRDEAAKKQQQIAELKAQLDALSQPSGD